MIKVINTKILNIEQEALRLKLIVYLALKYI
jgi:hypothetical protein